ncbi:MAG: guanylate kinase [Candidatus Eisenbacteria bacterium]|uniref:Guanylate kinase n=1 Tax=Eiseniibacteriota bacterium TaxID=2212470 RepID=A0A7Y2E568_UNCEI|nr:guanylate kinase [Candidatus Eisenbacteria bacterium]
MPQPQNPPLLIVVSGPSGVGKTRICNRLMENDSRLVRSISATTRPPRPGEEDGTDYFFWGEDEFKSAIGEGLFLEWAMVHNHRYGTLDATVDKLLGEQKSPVLNIDVQGGASVKAIRPDAVLIFLLPPSMKALEERLRGRSTDSEAVIATRLQNALTELKRYEDYDYVVVNDDFDQAVAQIESIMTAERARVRR